MVYSFNPSTQEAEAGEFKTSLAYRVIQNNQGYTKKPSLGEKKRQKQNKQKDISTFKRQGFLVLTDNIMK